MRPLIILLALLVPVLAFAQTNSSESLTITTYYPAPYGVYRNLKLSPTVEPQTGVSRGVMYFNDTTDTLKIYNNTGWNNISAGGGNGFWAENATTHDIHNTNTGGVGIGTDHPSAEGADLEVNNPTTQSTLVINGRASVGQTYSQMILESGQNSAINSWALAFKSVSNGFLILRHKTDGSSAMPLFIDQNGNVGMGGVVAPTEKLEVGGNIKAAGFFYSSDRSLKKNILPLSGSLDRIAQLQGISFQWKADNRRDIGLVAQDVEKVYPELVSTDRNSGLKSVEYGNLIAVLVEAVKEQQGQIRELKAEISNLKGRK